MVGGLLVGRSGTIVAYGQTASGKTHTTQGVMRLACEQVFDEGTAEGGVRVWASYLEVYDEKLTDLLDARSSVQVKDKPVVRVTGAHEVRIGSPNALDAVVNRGERNRKRGATRLNAKSSRSHAVLRLRVETDVRGVRFEATLCVVDLAGSEKPKRRKSGEHSQNGQRAWLAASIMPQLVPKTKSAKQILMKSSGQCRYYVNPQTQLPNVWITSTRTWQPCTQN